MKLSYLFFGNRPDEKWHLARQMGVRYAIAKLSPEHTGQLPPWDLDSLARSKALFEQEGLTLIGLEGDQFNMDRIKFGRDGRDEDLARYQSMLRNMGKLGIPLLCYNFMAGIGWFRTHTEIHERGGALVSGFSQRYAAQLEDADSGPLAESALWANYRYFLEAVLPIAEQSGVSMALHPDDPPVSPLLGIGRILVSPGDIDCALALSSSPAHGLTFCQGTVRSMGGDPFELASRWASRIRFVHVRDVAGVPGDFRETFHDNGPTDMPALFAHYRQLGLRVPLRSDHVPTLYGEDNTRHGYGTKGNLFGIGYIKGIMDALKLDYR